MKKKYMKPQAISLMFDLLATLPPGSSDLDPKLPTIDPKEIEDDEDVDAD